MRKKKSHNVQHKQKPSRKKKKPRNKSVGFFLARDFKKTQTRRFSSLETLKHLNHPKSNDTSSDQRFYILKSEMQKKTKSDFDFWRNKNIKTLLCKKGIDILKILNASDQRFYILKSEMQKKKRKAILFDFHVLYMYFVILPGQQYFYILYALIVDFCFYIHVVVTSGVPLPLSC